MHTIKKIFFALSRKERIAFVAAIILLAVSIIGFLIYAFSVKTQTAPSHGGEYAEGFIGQPAYINPILANSDIDRSIVRLAFSNLEALADKIEPDKDGRIWKVRLRAGLIWSDGRKLTSDDVIFTAQKIQDVETRSPLAASWQGVSAARLSELEIQFTLGAPYAFFRENLKSLYPAPKHLYNDIPVSNWRLSDHNLQPVGSGPYIFSSYEKETNGFIKEYRLTANSSYHDERPFIERITFAFFADGKGLLSAFNKGSIEGLASPDLALLEATERSYRTHEFKIPSYYAVFINQSQNIPLQELVVREALSKSINREELIRSIFNGHALVAYGPIPPGSGMASYQGEQSSSDAAAVSLESAGWLIGEDGTREKKIKNGTIKLELALTVPEIPFLIKTAEAIKIAWQKIGVQVDVNPLPVGETMAETIKNRDYQALLFGNVLQKELDLYPFWHSKERFSPGLNLALYSDKDVDAILEKMQREPDIEARKGLLSEVESKIVEEVPAIFLFSPDYLFIASKELQGVEARLVSEPSDRFLDAPSWYVKTSRTVR